jgi:hypothetical protein
LNVTSFQKYKEKKFCKVYQPARSQRKKGAKKKKKKKEVAILASYYKRNAAAELKISHPVPCRIIKSTNCEG